MAIFEIKGNRLEEIEATDFASQGIQERAHLQQLVRDQIEVLDPNLLVLSEEVGEWQDSRRRIDILCLDKDANLVVIELKRTEAGGHMELQALRYAAMVSAMTFKQATHLLAMHLENHGREESAEGMILEFLEWEEADEDAFAQDVKIVLASADFSKELTTAVLWLNERDLDIRCFRLRPYLDNARVLLDVQQVIPLPEATDFQVQLREKVRKEHRSRSGGRDTTPYDVSVFGKSWERQPKRTAIFHVVRTLTEHGVRPEEISECLGSKFDRR
ncbi:hypothetical protein ACFL3S_04935 [Gemmatimonadota bacterium]